MYRLLILSDGRPGHFNLSEGIAAAIARLRPTTIERLEVRRGRWPGAVLAALTRAQLPAGMLIKAIYGVPRSALPGADLIVSAGAETLAANIWLARLRNAPNVFYGSLRWFSPHDFRLVLTSYEHNAGRANHALTLKPSRLDARPKAAMVDAERTAHHSRPTYVLLIGGDAGGISYQPADWDHLIQLIKSAYATRGVRWLISNSRRTPTALSDRIAALAADQRFGIERFIDVRAEASGTLSELLAAADVIVCTDDSSSMVSEGIWARRPVIGLRPSHFTLTPDEHGYRDWLAAQRWMASLPLDTQTPERLAATVQELSPLQTNPLDALAQLLAQRIPELNA